MSRIVFGTIMAVLCAGLLCGSACGEEPKQKVYFPLRTLSEDESWTSSPINAYLELTMHLYASALLGTSTQKPAVEKGDRLLQCCVDVLDTGTRRDLQGYRALLCPDTPDLGGKTLEDHTYMWGFYRDYLAAQSDYHIYGYFDMNGYRSYLADMRDTGNVYWSPIFVPVSLTSSCHYPHLLFQKAMQVVQSIMSGDKAHGYAQIAAHTAFPAALTDPVRIRVSGVTPPTADGEIPMVLLSWLRDDDPKVKQVEEAKNRFLVIMQHQAVLSDLGAAYDALKQEMRSCMTGKSHHSYFGGSDTAPNYDAKGQKFILENMRRTGAGMAAALNRATGCVLGASPEYVWCARDTLAAIPERAETHIYNSLEKESALQFKEVNGTMLVSGVATSSLGKVINTPEFWTAMHAEWARRNPPGK